MRRSSAGPRRFYRPQQPFYPDSPAAPSPPHISSASREDVYSRKKVAGFAAPEWSGRPQSRIISSSDFREGHAPSPGMLDQRERRSYPSPTRQVSPQRDILDGKEQKRVVRTYDNSELLDAASSHSDYSHRNSHEEDLVDVSGQTGNSSRLSTFDEPPLWRPSPVQSFPERESYSLLQNRRVAGPESYAPQVWLERRGPRKPFDDPSEQSASYGHDLELSARELLLVKKDVQILELEMKNVKQEISLMSTSFGQVQNQLQTLTNQLQELFALQEEMPKIHLLQQKLEFDGTRMTQLERRVDVWAQSHKSISTRFGQLAQKSNLMQGQLQKQTRKLSNLEKSNQSIILPSSSGAKRSLGEPETEAPKPKKKKKKTEEETRTATNAVSSFQGRPTQTQKTEEGTSTATGDAVFSYQVCPNQTLKVYGTFNDEKVSFHVPFDRVFYRGFKITDSQIAIQLHQFATVTCTLLLSQEGRPTSVIAVWVREKALDATNLSVNDHVRCSGLEILNKEEGRACFWYGGTVKWFYFTSKLVTIDNMRCDDLRRISKKLWQSAWFYMKEEEEGIRLVSVVGKKMKPIVALEKAVNLGEHPIIQVPVEKQPAPKIDVIDDIEVAGPPTDRTQAAGVVTEPGNKISEPEKFGADGSGIRTNSVEVCGTVKQPENSAQEVVSGIKDGAKLVDAMDTV